MAVHNCTFTALEKGDPKVTTRFEGDTYSARNDSAFVSFCILRSCRASKLFDSCCIYSIIPGN